MLDKFELEFIRPKTYGYVVPANQRPPFMTGS